MAHFRWRRWLPQTPLGWFALFTLTAWIVTYLIFAWRMP